jgi:hypothetical protein
MTFADIIARWPSLTEFASDIGVPYGVAKTWRLRHRIPVDAWPAILSASRRRGLGVTADHLVQIIAEGLKNGARNRNGAARPATGIEESAKG